MGSLYERIERLGKAGGYKNMTVLCKAAGVPRTTMSELNAGRSKDLSKPTAQKFADLLGISLDDIYGTEKQKPANQKHELSGDAVAVAKAYDAATDKQKQMVRLTLDI